MENRLCKICKNTRPIEEFYLKRGYICKKCCNKSTPRKLELRKKRKKKKYSLAWLKPKRDKMKIRCKKRGLEFNISNEELIVLYKSPCFYCNETFSDMTIDRVDNDIGYVTGNCVSACRTCNTRKSSQKYEDFIRPSSQGGKR